MTPAQITKYQKKSIPELIKKAQEVFNKFIRLRDRQGSWFICISCGKAKSMEQCNASHYMSAGKYSPTRFDERNVNSSCIRCNMHLSGNLIEYRMKLIEKIGLAEVEAVELKAKMKHKHDRYTLIDIIITYSQKIKELE